jgi:hypothetical protein
VVVDSIMKKPFPLLTRRGNSDLEGIGVMPPHSEPIGPALEEITQIAQVTFHEERLCLHLCDASGSIYADEKFADLLSSTGRPAEILDDLSCCPSIPNSDIFPEESKAHSMRKDRQ